MPGRPAEAVLLRDAPDARVGRARAARPVRRGDRPGHVPLLDHRHLHRTDGRPGDGAHRPVGEGRLRLGGDRVEGARRVAAVTPLEREVEAAFHRHWTIGSLEERWAEWPDCLTEDVHYIEHVYGVMRG